MTHLRTLGAHSLPRDRQKFLASSRRSSFAKPFPQAPAWSSLTPNSSLGVPSAAPARGDSGPPPAQPERPRQIGFVSQSPSRGLLRPREDTDSGSKLASFRGIHRLNVGQASRLLILIPNLGSLSQNPTRREASSSHRSVRRTADDASSNAPRSSLPSVDSLATHSLANVFLACTGGFGPPLLFLFASFRVFRG